MASADVGAIVRAADAIAERVLGGATLYTFGNGGSAADSEHFAAEVLGRFARDRRPLAAHALTADSATLTAIANDYGYEEVFARQLRGLARPADVCVGISTSGESINVVKGLQAARDKGALTIALSGRAGGAIAAAAEIAIVVPEQHTGRIQEVQRTIIHAICEVVESRLP
jgi:D-sedoheptulose 7-phosphate isomerase